METCQNGNCKRCHNGTGKHYTTTSEIESQGLMKRVADLEEKVEAIFKIIKMLCNELQKLT